MLGIFRLATDAATISDAVTKMIYMTRKTKRLFIHVVDNEMKSKLLYNVTLVGLLAMQPTTNLFFLHGNYENLILSSYQRSELYWILTIFNAVNRAIFVVCYSDGTPMYDYSFCTVLCCTASVQLFVYNNNALHQVALLKSSSVWYFIND